MMITDVTDSPFIGIVNLVGHDVPVRDEVDDTDMTAAEFRAARDRGTPTQVVKSREEFDAH